MNKRGQATIIIFLALILVIIIGLIFFIKSKVYVGGTDIENLQRELDPIIRHIEKCLYESTQETAVLLGEQGGYLEPKENTYKLYNDKKISYLCYNKPGTPQCSNRYLRLSDVKEQLKQAITQKINKCVQIDSFEKAGYTITASTNKNINLNIGSDSIITTLNYPIKIKKGTAETQIEVFSKAVPLPLGRLFSAATDIINAESIIGKFDPLIYSLIKSKFTNKQYVIQLLKPHPDKLYILKIKNTPTEKETFTFQFFIEGESKL